MFIDELGFKELYGTDNIPTAQLGALGIQLKKLEHKYGFCFSSRLHRIPESQLVRYATRYNQEREEPPLRAAFSCV